MTESPRVHRGRVDVTTPRPGSLIGDTNLVATMLGISRRHVRRLAAEGTFRAVGHRSNGKQGRPALMFDLRQVAEAWAADHDREVTR